MKRLRAGLAGLALIVTAYLAAALLGAMIPGQRASLAPGDQVEVFLVRSPIHYDFLIPLTPEIQARFGWTSASGLDPYHPGAEWLVIGWGGHTFYTQTRTYRDTSALAVWRGITGDGSVLRIALAGPRDPDWPTVRLTLSQAQLNALLTEIESSLQDGTNTAAIPGYSEFDRFFAAKGRFHIFRTCNVWVGQTLRAAGVSFGVWTPTPYAVTLAAHLHTP